LVKAKVKRKQHKENMMAVKKLTPKQRVIASKKPPKNKITGADFLAMKGRKTKVRKKT
jgi:hypothetical protein